MNVYISGGSKNGKSYFAQLRARDLAVESGLPLYYIATMIPTDQEDRARIKRHIQEREGWGFTTIEKANSIRDILDEYPIGVYLLDSVTAALANEMFTSSGVNLEAGKVLAEDLKDFAEKVEAGGGSAIFVSDNIFGDEIPLEDLTDHYGRNLAYVDKEMAKLCQEVYEVTFGNPVRIK